jgi:hypothetical protein
MAIYVAREVNTSCIPRKLAIVVGWEVGGI